MTFQHSSQSIDDQQYPYRMLFEIVNESGDQFRVIAKALHDPIIDKWTNLSGMALKLNMTGSGRSGSILLKNDTVPELFSITAGIHDFYPWCDILPNLPDEASADRINQSYHQSQFERNWSNACKRTSKGTSISISSSELRDGTFVAKVTLCKETPIADLDDNQVCDSLDLFCDC